MSAPPELLTTDQVMALTGATRHQLQYWIECGYLQPTNAHGGSGLPRRWPPEEVLKVQGMSAMITAGLEVMVAGCLVAKGQYARLQVVSLQEAFPFDEVFG